MKTKNIVKSKEKIKPIKTSFFKINIEKIAIFTIISTFIPTYLFLLLCGGYQPVFLFLLESFFQGDLFFAFILSIPSLILNYIITYFIYKIILFINKEIKKDRKWQMIAILLALSILIYFLSLGIQGISC